MFKRSKSKFTEPCDNFEPQFWRKARCRTCFFNADDHLLHQQLGKLPARQADHHVRIDEVEEQIPPKYESDSPRSPHRDLYNSIPNDNSNLHNSHNHSHHHLHQNHHQDLSNPPAQTAPVAGPTSSSNNNIIATSSPVSKKNRNHTKQRSLNTSNSINASEETPSKSNKRKLAQSSSGSDQSIGENNNSNGGSGSNVNNSGGITDVSQPPAIVFPPASTNPAASGPPTPPSIRKATTVGNLHAIVNSGGVGSSTEPNNRSSHHAAITQSSPASTTSSSSSSTSKHIKPTSLFGQFVNGMKEKKDKHKNKTPSMVTSPNSGKTPSSVAPNQTAAIPTYTMEQIMHSTNVAKPDVMMKEIPIIPPFIPVLPFDPSILETAEDTKELSVTLDLHQDDDRETPKEKPESSGSTSSKKKFKKIKTPLPVSSPSSNTEFPTTHSNSAEGSSTVVNPTMVPPDRQSPSPISNADSLGAVPSSTTKEDGSSKFITKPEVTSPTAKPRRNSVSIAPSKQPKSSKSKKGAQAVQET